jgi:hypothetical protein
MKKLGVHTHIFSATMVRHSLLLACGALDPTPRVAKQKRQGRPPLKAGDPMTDEMLARLRGDYELRGECPEVLHKRYGITRDRCRQLLSGVNRCHIKAA